MKDRFRNEIGAKEPLKEWSDINWKTTKKRVRNLRRRIYRAKQNGQWNKVRNLMKLMLRSYSNLLLSVRRVTQENKGRGNYYRHGVSQRVFSYIDHELWKSFWHWSLRRHSKRVGKQKGKGKKWVRKKYFKTINGNKWIFATNITNRHGKEETIAICRLTKIPIQRHVKIKGTASPDDPALAQYWEQRHTKYGKIHWDKGSKYFKVAHNQNWKCPVCGEHLFNEEELHTHHKTLVKDGGTDKIDNLVHLHKACHKHAHTGKQSVRQEA